MNEGPPIASPFGEPNAPLIAVPGRDAPLLLKVLAGLHWGLGLFTLVLTTTLNKKVLAGTHFYLWSVLVAGVVIIALLSSLICYGLLRASKTSWWLTQAGFVFGIYSLVHTLSTPHHARSQLGYTAPLPLRLLIWTVQITLSIYLLTPAMRQFFFSRPQAK